MALTDEQQQAVDMQNATELYRSNIQATVQAKQNKLTCMTMAQQIILENRRVKAASEVSDITSNDITTLAAALLTYLDS